MENTDLHPEGVVGLMLRLRGHGITDPQWLSLVESVPHDRFVPVQYFDQAWRDCSLPIDCGQTMHSPDTIIRMVHALGLESSHNVLEIGTGSGYLTALLSKLANKVFSIDRYKSLISAASDRLLKLGCSNVTFSQCDSAKAPDSPGLYDRIIADTAFDSMPRELLDVLVSGGVVVTAIGDKGAEQTVVRLTKIGSRFEREDLYNVRFGTFEKGTAKFL